MRARSMNSQRSCQRRSKMADSEVDEDSDFERQGSTEHESLSTESSYDGSPLSPRSDDSDWNFGVSESAGFQNGFDPEKHREELINAEKKASIVDCLLFEIYDQYHSRDSVDSDNVTECSTTSGSFYDGSFDLEERGESWTRNELLSKGKFLHKLSSNTKELVVEYFAVIVKNICKILAVLDSVNL